MPSFAFEIDQMLVGTPVFTFVTHEWQDSSTELPRMHVATDSPRSRRISIDWSVVDVQNR